MAAEQLVAFLGGATCDLFFWSRWYICQVLTVHSGQWRPMLDATLGLLDPAVGAWTSLVLLGAVAARLCHSEVVECIHWVFGRLLML